MGDHRAAPDDRVAEYVIAVAVVVALAVLVAVVIALL